MPVDKSQNSHLNRKAPGVYLTETDAVEAGIVGVPTAMPIFIGYTEFAGDPITGKPLYLTPVAISSLEEFADHFGGPAPADYVVTAEASAELSDGDPSGPSPIGDPPLWSFLAHHIPVAAEPAAIAPFLLARAAPADEATRFNLYWSMKAFFANGGSHCYVVSAGSYWPGKTPTAKPDPATAASRPLARIAFDALDQALTAAGSASGPTMTVMPEACQLAVWNDPEWTFEGYDRLAQGMLRQASVLQDRIAILDLPGCRIADTKAALVQSLWGLADAIPGQFDALGYNPGYGVCYAPAMIASVVTTEDISYASLSGSGDNAPLNAILTAQAVLIYKGAALDEIQAAIAAAFPLPPGNARTNDDRYSNDDSAHPGIDGTQHTDEQGRGALDNLLVNRLPLFREIKARIVADMNILPPSGFVAGLLSANDERNGVWSAPANIAVAATSKPLCEIRDQDQARFNVPENGQAINIIRSQPDRGAVVWGARTLNGNSTDNRYIQIRRTLIYVEQSIKRALQSYVFAANDAATWARVTAATSTFLTGLWQQGGLMGAKPSEAFTVSCGLGSTMTGQDILDGIMIVTVNLQLIHLGEFIELTFSQSMTG